MREITAGELSKILKEHKRWLDTDEDEGEKEEIQHYFHDRAESLLQQL